MYLYENKHSTNLYPVPNERKYKANNKTHTCRIPPLHSYPTFLFNEFIAQSKTNCSSIDYR